MSKDSETKTRDRNLEEIARLLGRPVTPKQVVIESALDDEIEFRRLYGAWLWGVR